MAWPGYARRRAGGRTDQSLLRKLGSGWEVLRLSGLAWRPLGDLVDAWEAKSAGTGVSVHRDPGAGDEWPVKFAGASVQSGWAKAVCDWAAVARGARAIRRSDRAVCPVSGWRLRQFCGLFARWAMGCVCCLSGRNIVAEPARWKRAVAVNVCTHGGDGAEVVSGWEQDSVLRDRRGERAAGLLDFR